MILLKFKKPNGIKSDIMTRHQSFIEKSFEINKTLKLTIINRPKEIVFFLRPGRKDKLTIEELYTTIQSLQEAINQAAEQYNNETEIQIII